MSSHSERESSGEEFCVIPTRKRKTKKGRNLKRSGRPTFMSNWVLETKFSDEKAALDHLTEEEIWSADPHRRYATQTGRKAHFRCNRVKNNGLPCPILKCLYYPNNLEEVWLYKTNTPHNHDKTSSPIFTKEVCCALPSGGAVRRNYRHPMENSLQIRIGKLLKQMESPKDILTQLESEGFEVKHREIQIRNYCSRARFQGSKSQSTSRSILERTFTSIEEAKLYLKMQKIWHYKFQNDSLNGMTYHYRCNLVPKVGPQCAARKYFRFNEHTNEARLYQKDCPHTHAEIIRNAHLNNKEKTNWLLKQLHKCDRNALLNQGFKVLRAVGLQDCLVEPTDCSTSFHDKLFMLQQETCPNLDYQIKDEVVTDDDNFTTIPVEVNLYEGNDDNNKTLSTSKRKSRKPLFTADWIYEGKFPNEQTALEYLAKDNIWHIDPRRVYPIAGGRKVHYRCNRVKINGPQCAAWKCLLYAVDTDVITLYKTDSEHTHNKIAVEFRKSKTSIKRRMLKERLKLGIKKINDANGPSIIPKRGRPCKRPQHLKPKEVTITDSIKAESYTNCSSDLHISNGSPANSMEFITGEDSIQYVINYIDDDQTTNADDISQVAEKSTQSSDGNSNWLCEQSFATYDEARTYLKESAWSCVSNAIYGGQRKTYYRCNIVKKFGPQCDARAYLLCCSENNTILFYRNLSPHTHDQKINAGIALRNRHRKNIEKPELEVAPLITTIHSEISTELVTCDDTSGNQLMEVDNDDNAISDITRDKEIEWSLEDKIPTSDMVPSYLNKQNTWRCNYRSGKSSKVLYSCTTKKCDAQMCLIYKKASIEVLVYRSGKHTHSIPDDSVDLPSHFNFNKVIPDSYPNSNIVMKEEVIIDADEPVAVTQNEPDVVDTSDDYEQMASTQKWNLEKTFAHMNELNEFLASSDGLWELKSTTDGKLFYRCTFPCEPECPAIIFFLFQNNLDEVLYFSGDSHTHPLVNETVQSPPSTEEVVILDSDTEEPVIEPTDAAVNCADLIKNNSVPAPKLNDYTYKEKFANIIEARNYLKQEAGHWVSTCTRRFQNTYRQYYWCNYNEERGKCTCRVFLLGKHDRAEVLYYVSGFHIHDVKLDDSKKPENLNPATVSQTLVERTEEIIISDDSDKDSLNGDDVENNREKWIFETKFDDYKTAKHYMKNLNLLSFKSNISKYGVKEYFNCNLVSNGVDHCPSSKYLLYEDANSAILMFNRDIRHADVCRNVIPPLVPIQKRAANIIDLIESDDNDEDNDPNVIMLSESEEEEKVENSLVQQEISINFGRAWIIEKLFETAEKAQEYINYQQIWSIKVKSKSKEDVKEFYRCNLAKKSGPQCAAAKFIHIIFASKVVILYKTEQKHTHDPHTPAAQAYQMFESLDDNIKEKIHELIMVSNTPKQILAKLGIQNVLTEKPLCYYIAKIRRNMLQRGRIASSVSFIKAIENWLSHITTVPENDDTYYCVSFNVDHLNKSFRSFLSTRRLLKNAIDANLVHIDSSCGLTWQYNPITLIGTTDLEQSFFLFGIAICSNKNECDYEFMFKTVQKGVQECHKKIFKPECLMADDNEAIRTAFIKRFGISSKIGVCSKLALSKILLKLSSCTVSDVLKNQIQEDILNIQKLSTPRLFAKAVDLFFLKWRPSAQLHDFLYYFKANWIDKNTNWFQGFRPFTPHTNKAIRFEYDALKKKYTFNRQNQSKQTQIESFRSRIQNEVEQLSRRYNFNEYSRKTAIPISVYEKATEWNNLEKQIEIVHQDTEIRYYISTGSESLINEEKLEKYRACNQTSLDDFFDIQFSFWYVRQLKNNTTLTCNCPYFLENYLCEHSVGMASVLNLIKFPEHKDCF